MSLQLYKQIFGHTGRKKLDRHSLPSPTQYLAERSFIKTKIYSEWISIYCPAHKDGAEKNPSLRVNLIDGHFRCMACGIKGGDIIALHRVFTGLSFLDAVRDVGGHFYD